MEYQLPVQLLQDSSISGAYNNNNENGDYDDYLDDMGMSSSIMSFEEPNLNEIAQQNAILVFNLTQDNNTQVDDNIEYDFFEGYEDVFMPDTVESFDGPNMGDVALP
ncbi:hypothetical protein BGZ96_009861 [Linnemannia gamsii]|uniref:Uncharacterized protein n=1 Tax=Linnemannia gamsii TaxID=64522 RepID=A0ABQ7JVF2_9FUNG|nr:hypothetical protein BGZ96_009861 [Linnemannia gamsii]